MDVVVTVQHPAHVHFFKHAIGELEAAGHDVHVFGRENEVTAALLSAYDIDYEMLAGTSSSLPSLARVQATYETRLLARAWEIDPDVIAAIGGVAASHVAAAVGARSVVFYDTEHAALIQRLAYPFADEVCTPSCYAGDAGEKQVRYPGYHELAYLHPDRFSPDESVLDEADVDPDETLAVCRFSSWDSSHDVGQGGFADLAEVVERLETAGATVRLTSEVDLPPGLDSRTLSVDPDRLHDLLYYADVSVGEGATMAAESALLGTPAVYPRTRVHDGTRREVRTGLRLPRRGPSRRRTRPGSRTARRRRRREVAAPPRQRPRRQAGRDRRGRRPRPRRRVTVRIPHSLPQPRESHPHANLFLPSSRPDSDRPAQALKPPYLA